MATDERIYDLMLDALRLGFLARNAGKPVRDERTNATIAEQIKFICVNIGQLDYEHKMQVCLAIVRIAGQEALGEYNCGAFVNITNWTPGQINDLYKVVQFSTK